MIDDPRLLFVVRALHCISEQNDGLDPDEVRGLQRIIETVVIDARKEALK